MGNSTSKLKNDEISLVIFGILFVCYIIAVGFMFGTRSKISTSAPSTHGTTSTPTTPPSTTAPTVPHLTYTSEQIGLVDAPVNFYNLGCRAALYEGYFPFNHFNTKGTYHNGILQDYFTYDTW